VNPATVKTPPVPPERSKVVTGKTLPERRQRKSRGAPQKLEENSGRAFRAGLWGRGETPAYRDREPFIESLSEP
jgi:hypothetical protein